jgi:hypothetical protein
MGVVAKLRSRQTLIAGSCRWSSLGMHPKGAKVAMLSISWMWGDGSNLGKLKASWSNERTHVHLQYNVYVALLVSGT